MRINNVLPFPFLLSLRKLFGIECSWLGTPNNPPVSQRKREGASYRDKRELQLTIKTLTGSSCLVNVGTYTTVLELKEMIHVKLGIPVDKCPLIHNGIQLDDERTLELYNIRDGDSVYHLLRISGC